MKISFMTFMTPEWSLDEVLAGARRHGYDGIEIRVVAKQKHGVEPDASADARKEARRKIEDSGIALACIATSCRFADNDPAKRQANVDSLKRHVELAADMGAPGIRVFGGGKAEGLTQADANIIVAEDMAKGCAGACDAGVGIWLETHDHFCSSRDVAEVVERAGCACIAVNWDVMHPYRTAHESTAETWRNLKEGKIVRHTHLHDGLDDQNKLVLLPIGEGNIPHHEPLRLLRDAGYQGYLSAEYIGEMGPPDASLERFITSLRKVLAEI